MTDRAVRGPSPRPAAAREDLVLGAEHLIVEDGGQPVRRHVVPGGAGSDGLVLGSQVGRDDPMRHNEGVQEHEEQRACAGKGGEPASPAACYKRQTAGTMQPRVE